MFSNPKKTGTNEKASSGSGATLVSAGTTMRGDISSDTDLRIDGTVKGNIQCSAKVLIGANGVVEGDISGTQADIVGKVTGTIRVKELVQLRGECVVTGNLFAGKLQVEPTATFNGECHMGNNIVEMKKETKLAPAVAK